MTSPFGARFGAPVLSRALFSIALTSVACLAAAPAQAQAQAQDYPTRPVELVVYVQPGGGTDTMARAFADAARKHFPQPLLVVNKPGAAGSIAFTEVANSKPDGYKVGVVSINLVILPALKLMKVDAGNFTPIARLNFDPSAITVRADAPWKTIEEFLADAKKRPGEIQVGNGGLGDIWHVASAALQDKTQTQFNDIPYQGAAPAIASLLGGHIDAVAVSPGEVSQHVAGGKLRVLAVMADQRLAGMFAQAPTLKERNIDLSIGVWRGLAVPKGTPTQAVNALRAATRATAADPAFRETLARANLGEAYADADEFAKVIDADARMLKPVLEKLVINK